MNCPILFLYYFLFSLCLSLRLPIRFVAMMEHLEGGNLVQAAAIQRARRLRALTADTEERKRIFRMRSSPEILEAPDSRRSQHLNDGSCNKIE